MEKSRRQEQLENHRIAQKKYRTKYGKSEKEAFENGKRQALHDLFYKPMPRFKKMVNVPVSMIEVRENVSDDGEYEIGWNDCFDELLAQAKQIVGELKNE